MSSLTIQSGKNRNHIRKSRADRIFDTVIYTAAGLLTLLALYPMYFILILVNQISRKISDTSLF